MCEACGHIFTAHEDPYTQEESRCCMPGCDCTEFQQACA